MGGKYDDLNVDDLRSEAKRRELSASGTKAELVARLETADAEQAAAQAAKANPLLAGDRTVDVDAALAFADDVRTLAGEMGERLTVEVSGPLAEMEGSVADPNAGRLLAASRRLRGHVDDVQRALRALSAAAGTLGQDAVG